MTPIFKRNLYIAIGALAIFFLVSIELKRRTDYIIPADQFTGYVLLTVMICLASFNLRKRLSMLPLGRAAVWTSFHVYGGLLAVGLFWLHVQKFWPEGFYEQKLTACFYLLSLSGIIGFLLLRLYPARLADSGLELIYERIPMELAETRERAEKVVLECVQKNTSETLARFYSETMSWYFAEPRFFFSHAVGGKAGGAFITSKAKPVKRYLNDSEKQFLEDLIDLAFYKDRIDFHYAAQSIMKKWLLLHIPLSAATLVLTVWHYVLVNAYAL